MTDLSQDIIRESQSDWRTPDDRDEGGAMSPLMLQLVLSFGGADTEWTDPRTWPSLGRKAHEAVGERH
jgi:hypothetical protein